jgi:hypothetical protein
MLEVVKDMSLSNKFLNAEDAEALAEVCKGGLPLRPFRNLCGLCVKTGFQNKTFSVSLSGTRIVRVIHGRDARATFPN